MDIRPRTCRLTLATLTAMALWPAAARAQMTAPVVLRAYGIETLPPGIADRAREVVGQIYSAAGARVEWRTASSDASFPGGFQISLIIRRQSEADAPPSVLGFAPAPHGRLVYILYDHVEVFAVTNHLDIGHALGHVMAHEVGHVLLPARAHSKDGLMSGNLDFQPLRARPHMTLLFTARQAAQIRERLTTSEAVAFNSEF